ncbi:MAG: hypothetical protein ABIP51_07880 [Bacteroidia bacterium]
MDIKILGIDLSTTVMGYCILDEKGEIELLNYYSFKSKEMLEKADELKTVLNFIFSKYEISDFFIEERLQGFRAGGTNADAMFKTAALNFYCQVLIKERNIPITALNVIKARNLVFPGFFKFARTVKGTKHKEIIFKFVKEKLGETIFPTKVMKSGKNKGKTEFLEEAKDMSDSWVIASAGLKIKN